MQGTRKGDDEWKCYAGRSALARTLDEAFNRTRKGDKLVVLGLTKVALTPPKLTGGKSQHYQLHIKGVDIECLDIIEELNMNFAEGEAFKALWRKAASRQGNGKLGNTELYDAQKVEHYGKRMVAHLSRKE